MKHSIVSIAKASDWEDFKRKRANQQQTIRQAEAAAACVSLLISSDAPSDERNDVFQKICESSEFVIFFETMRSLEIECTEKQAIVFAIQLACWSLSPAPPG